MRNKKRAVMPKPKLKREAQKTYGSGPMEGWFYENAKSIDVYVRDRVRKVTLTCRIPRKLLVDWIRRTET